MGCTGRRRRLVETKRFEGEYPLVGCAPGFGRPCSNCMPPRRTRKSHRPRVSDRTLVPGFLVTRKGFPVSEGIGKGTVGMITIRIRTMRRRPCESRLRKRIRVRGPSGVELGTGGWLPSKNSTGRPHGRSFLLTSSFIEPTRIPTTEVQHRGAKIKS